MDIDISLLRMLETEHEIPLNQLISTIEQALLLAYHKSPGAIPQARAEVDTKTGKVTIWAVEYGDDDQPIGEFDDTPLSVCGWSTIFRRSCLASTLCVALSMQLLPD